MMRHYEGYGRIVHRAFPLSLDKPGEGAFSLSKYRQLTAFFDNLGMPRHYIRYVIRLWKSPIVHERLRLDEADYWFDLSPEQGIHGYLLSPDSRLPAKPTTLILCLEQENLFVAIYLSPLRFDMNVKKFQYQLFLSECQPDDRHNLAIELRR